MIKPIFIAVDGGATKSRVRIESEDGALLGEFTSGPANIRLSVNQAWDSITAAIDNILKPLALQKHLLKFHLGLGLAGCEIKQAQQAFIQYPHGFDTVFLTSDAHIAALGAHLGQNGAVIIVGTGVVGYQLEQGEVVKVGGWGFPHDDEGGGAWLGFTAIQLCLQVIDGRLSPCPLTRGLLAKFNNSEDALITWANEANATQYATLAPLVLSYATSALRAQLLLQHAGQAIEKIAQTLTLKKKLSDPLPCVLMGGLSQDLLPYLSDTLRARLSDAKGSALDGAMTLIRNAYQQKLAAGKKLCQQ